jgi:hypothetical protein
MSDQRPIELTEAQLERVWTLTAALVTHEGTSKRSLDQLMIAAARFVERVEQGYAGEGVELDSGKSSAAGRLTFLLRRPTP